MRIEAYVWVAFAAAIAAIFYLSGDGFYRYPCQDPTNQGKPECTPPECVADGTCTDYLVEIHK